MAPRKTTAPKAPKAPRARKAASKTAVQPMATKANQEHPEAGREPTPTYRADMGEGLPPQKDTLNPNRAK